MGGKLVELVHESDQYKVIIKGRPKIICLCGSTKFVDKYDRQMLRFTLSGHIVLTIGTHRNLARKYADGFEGGENMLDELHKRKIDLCDEVFVINVSGYLGGSTRSEIAYAMEQGKPVEYLEPVCTKIYGGAAVRLRPLLFSGLYRVGH